MTGDRTAVLILVAAVMTAGACGGKGGSSADAGPGGDGPVDTGPVDTGAVDTGPVDTGAPGCDPAAQNCGAAQKCDFGCQGSTAAVTCLPSTDGGAIGSSCSASTPCAAGAGCLSAGAMAVACRKYCVGDGDCATGERCHNVNVAITCGGQSTSLALHYCY